MGRNVLNASRKDLQFASVYEASNDEYTQHRVLNRKKLQQSPNHNITKSANNQYDVELDKQANDYDDMFMHKGSVISPDEILEYSRKTSMLVPVKHREEFPNNVLPSSDLTRVLHYYTSKKVSGTPGARKRGLRAFDETALLALGVLVDHLVDGLVDQEAGRICIENTQDGDDSVNDEQNIMENESENNIESDDDSDSDSTSSGSSSSLG